MLKTAFYTPGLIYKRPEGEIGAHYTVENLPFVVTLNQWMQFNVEFLLDCSASAELSIG